MKRTLLGAAAAAGLVLAGTLSPLLLPAATGPLASLPEASAANVDYYLKLEGVEGESSDDRHKNEIDIESFSWGVTSPRDAASGLPTGKRQHKPISFTKMIDKASPILMRSAFDGKHYPTLVLTGVDEDGFEFMRLSFSDVFVTDFQQQGNTSGRPTESLSFNYSKIEFEYKMRGAGGQPGQTFKAGYDLKQNKGI